MSDKSIEELLGIPEKPPLSPNVQAILRESAAVMLPCPFCGKPAKIEYRRGQHFNEFYVAGCFVEITSDDGTQLDGCGITRSAETARETVAKWNTRSDGVVEHLRAALRKAGRFMSDMTKNGRTTDDAIGEAERLLVETLNALNECHDRDAWFIVRLTKISDALADRPSSPSPAEGKGANA